MSASGSTRADGKPLLTRTERLIGVFTLLFVLGALGYGGFVLNREQQQSAFDADAAAVARELDGAVANLETLLTTLIGMHHNESGADSLLTLSAELRRQAPAISSVGRYASIDGTQRDTFERELLDSGLYEFRITALDAQGHVGARATASRHYPVSLLEPMTPRRLRLLGADLGVVDALGEALERIAATDGTLVTSLPAHWPAGGDLLLFHPTYRGNHTPSHFAERLRQSDGGYWLAVDPEKLLDNLGARPARFESALHIADARGERQLLLGRGASEPPGGLLHSHRTVERRWPLGDGELVLTLEGRTGVSRGLITGIAVIALLVLLSTLFIASHVRNDRHARRERRRAALALQTERERADRTLNAIDEAVFALDAEHRILHLNPAAARLVGATREHVLGRSLDETLALHHEDSGDALDLETTLTAIESGGAREIDVAPAPDANEAGVVLRLTVSRTRDADGTQSGHILVLRDISDERRLMRRLEFQADHDALTGCTNRRWFERRLGELLADMPSSGRSHALCYLDLDQFKIVNDTKGHAAGDQLLKELTGKLQSLCRDGDALSRLGGDEFGLLVVDADEREARRAVERIHDFFQSYVFRHGDDAFAVRASIGLVPLDATCGSIGEVLAAADLACYAAKEAGRNGIYVYAVDDEAMARRSSELNRLPELQRALAEDRFELHVQAVASLDGDAPGEDITHFEFLLRLTGEDGRAIAPFRIIEAAERYGLMREIDRWVISHALACIAAIGDGPGRDCSFSINLSGQSAADPALIGFIESEYDRHAIEPSRVWFELTETAAISQFSVAVELATRIQALGSKVALDDFGSGLSSFGYLKNIPVDVLKIDGQFVRHIAENPIDRTMVRAMTDVGKSMGIVIVAEFVEDQAIVDELVNMGIDYAQGYHIGKPRPLPEALAALQPVFRHAA